MLGVWPLATEQGRESLAFLIAHMPCDGRYEVVIREAQKADPMERLLEEHGRKDILNRGKAP